MRSANTATINLLATGQYVRVELWTITLNGGTIIRWHSGDRNVSTSYGGNIWTKGPALKRGAMSEKTGLDVATLELDIMALSSDLINGLPIIPFIANHGLDNASVKLERAYAPDWTTMFGSGPVGTSIRFAGKVTSVNSIQGAIAALTISSWLVLLNADMPRNLYQAACMHTVYDIGCTLNPTSFAVGGHFTGAVAAGANGGNTNLTQADGYFSLGRLVMTSGANNGISRTIKRYVSAAGAILFSTPLPNAIANGDTFTAYAGCDLTRATCLSRFNNLANYKGTDFVPLPQTPITIPSTSTTTTSGKG